VTSSMAADEVAPRVAAHAVGASTSMRYADGSADRL
jgi:hypothetical protein